MKIPHPFKQMRQDLQAATERDPAASSPLEVALLYPGVHAVWSYRISHSLWNHGMRLPARLMQNATRFFTGVDIHPAATIGERPFIDHAMGVVIGETAEIGDDVLIFHQVTLGGVTMTPGKRHPTVGDRVILGAGAKILGPVTVSSDAKVGANAVVVHDVPEKGVAVGVPSHLVSRDGSRGSQRHGLLEKRTGRGSREASACLPSERDHVLVSEETKVERSSVKTESGSVEVQKASYGFCKTYVHEDGVMVEPAMYI